MKRLTFVVEVSEPSGDEEDYEQEICEILFTIFEKSVSLLDYAANNSIALSRIQTDPPALVP